jgi:hypothetical protein
MIVRERELERESEAWKAFREVLRREEAAFGWPVAAAAAHIEFWMSRAADALEAMSDGSYRAEDFEVDVDTENERRLEEWMAASIMTARPALEAARARILVAWTLLPDPSPEAVEVFEGDTVEHYEEHTP